jgi:hypothetical protein
VTFSLFLSSPLLSSVTNSRQCRLPSWKLRVGVSRYVTPVLSFVHTTVFFSPASSSEWPMHARSVSSMRWPIFAPMTAPIAVPRMMATARSCVSTREPTAPPIAPPTTAPTAAVLQRPPTTP